MPCIWLYPQDPDVIPDAAARLAVREGAARLFPGVHRRTTTTDYARWIGPSSDIRCPRCATPLPAWEAPLLPELIPRDGMERRCAGCRDVFSIDGRLARFDLWLVAETRLPPAALVLAELGPALGAGARAHESGP